MFIIFIIVLLNNVIWIDIVLESLLKTITLLM